jgi:mannan endo-1,4-beta-mannosidase
MSTIALRSAMRSPLRAVKCVGAGAILVLLAACGGSSLDSSPPDPAGTAAQRSNEPGVSAAQFAHSFVTREGSKLMVAGQHFRFSGANVEYLGLKNYGPAPSKSIPVGSYSYPTQYEVDDALATAHDMGVTVIRAQTLGDTVGCPLCIEPAQGVFNDAAFAQMDMVVAEVRKYGIKLIGEFDGDAGGTGSGESYNWYCTWRNISSSSCATAFLTDPNLIGDYKQHMQAILTHVNPLTGLAYKDDPTFLGWADGNNLNLDLSAITFTPSGVVVPPAVSDAQMTA